MAYRLHYSDYPGTDTGPPDPERWVGPPGPPGPQGEQGIPGPVAAGGPFLPLSGGTVTGNVSIGSAQPNYMALAGGAAGVPARIVTVGPWADLQVLPQAGGKLYITMSRNWPAASGALEMTRFDYSMTGTNSGQSYSAEVHAIDQDTVTGSGVGYFNFLGGPNAGAMGGRTAFGVNFQPSGVTSIGASNFYVASAVFASTAYNAGGTVGARWGGFFASNDMALLSTGATYWEELCGYELDVGAATGTSFSYKHGMKVNLWNTDAVAGLAGADSAYSLSASNAATIPTSGWDYGFAFGDGYGYWPMKTSGRMIGVVAGPGGGPAKLASWGIDFSTVTFSGGFLRGPGFTVNGTGGVSFSGFASSSQDLSRHLDLHSGVTGFCVDASGTLNYNVQSGDVHNFFVGPTIVGQFSLTGLNVTPVGQSTAAAGSFTTLSASSTVSGAGFTTLLAPYALTSSVPVVNTVTTPIMDGTATIGTLATYARPDHVHPTDTSRYAATNPSGYQTAAQVTTALAAGSPGSFSTLSASGAVSGAGFSTYLASPPSIGGTAAAAGSFTTLSATGVVSGAGFTTLLSTKLSLTGGTMSSAIHFSGTASAFNDLSQHIDLKSGTTGFCVDASGTVNYVAAASVHNFWIAGSFAAQFSAAGLNSTPVGQGAAAAGAFTTVALNSTSGPTIRAGTGAATGTQPNGSLWLRTDGTAGARLYVSAGAGTWTAVATV